MNQALVLVWNLSLMVAIRLNNIHKGSDRDFVFRREASLWEPLQATIGLQRSVLPDVGGHWCTAPFVFYENNLAYVTLNSELPMKLPKSMIQSRQLFA